MEIEDGSFGSSMLEIDTVLNDLFAGSGPP
jgi:hypothetical protein